MSYATLTRSTGDADAALRYQTRRRPEPAPTATDLANRNLAIGTGRPIFEAQPDRRPHPSLTQAPRPMLGGAPIAFVRSALFSVADGDGMLRAETLPAPDGYALTYTGPRLGQWHACLWQALMSIAVERQTDPEADAVLDLSRGELLRVLGWKDTGTKSKQWLWKMLRDLQAASIELRSSRQRYADVLVSSLEMSEATCRMRVRIPARARALLCDEVVRIDLRRKRALPKSPLALWLHDFLSSMSNDPSRWIPWSVNALRRMSGSTLPMHKFRAKLRIAANALMTCPDPLLTAWKIDAQDRLVFEKVNTRVVMLRADSGARAILSSVERHEQAVRAAVAQRTHLVL